jgi:hypothetical protein
MLGWYLTDMRRDLAAAERVLLDGATRYPQFPGIVNNLAYVLLMDGRPGDARRILASFGPKVEQTIEDAVALMATWGLLYFWEGDLVTGREFYERAEKMAGEAVDENLPATVRQKMHLELAKAHLRRHDMSSARAEVSRGLSVRGGREVYRLALASTSESL